MNVNLQTCDSCFKSETLFLFFKNVLYQNYCSIKIPLPFLSEIHLFALSWILCSLSFGKKESY